MIFEDLAKVSKLQLKLLAQAEKNEVLRGLFEKVAFSGEGWVLELDPEGGGEVGDFPVQIDMALNLVLQQAARYQTLISVETDQGRREMWTFLACETEKLYTALDGVWLSMVLELHESQPTIARLVFEARRSWPAGISEDPASRGSSGL